VFCSSAFHYEMTQQEGPTRCQPLNLGPPVSQLWEKISVLYKLSNLKYSVIVAEHGLGHVLQQMKGGELKGWAHDQHSVQKPVFLQFFLPLRSIRSEFKTASDTASVKLNKLLNFSESNSVSINRESDSAYLMQIPWWQSAIIHMKSTAPGTWVFLQGPCFLLVWNRKQAWIQGILIQKTYSGDKKFIHAVPRGTLSTSDECLRRLCAGSNIRAECWRKGRDKVFQAYGYWGVPGMETTNA
jgi:hypothetical protein